MKKALYLLPLTIAFLAANPAKASLAFSDDFSSGLGGWSGPFGEVVSDATYGQALSFSGLDSGGDFYTTTFSATAGQYINFAYKGVGGFLGAGGPGANWYAGEPWAYGVPNTLANSTSWTSYSILIPYSGAINLEDFSGTPGSSPGSAEFADITVSDSPIVTSPSTPTAVPEASTVISGGLMLVPLGVSAFRMFRKKNQVA